MSGVNITILEGGKAENFGQVTKLRTSNGNDHDLWVPKTDVKTSHLSVKKNGLHYTNQYEPTASEKKNGKFHDVYGWDTITVSVKKKVTGKKKKTNPSTGIEYDVPTTVEVDDDDNLVEKEYPSSIRIVKEPTTTHYVGGQSISIAGIKVKGYFEDGSEWGDVPFEELSFEPTVAAFSGDEYSDGDGVNAIKISYTNHQYTLNTVVGRVYDSYACAEQLGTRDGVPATIGGGNNASYYITRYNDGLYAFLISGDNALNLYVIHSSPYTTSDGRAVYTSVSEPNVYLFSAGSSYRATQGKFTKASFGEYITNIPESTKDPTKAGELNPVGSTQTVTVSWIPDDLEIELTDTYEITVGQGPIPPNA